jgi:hypothetical protein
MSYKCQVCGKTTATNMGMRKHMISSLLRFKEHWQWMNAHSVTPPKKIATGNYQPLMELIEKECKVED